MDNSVLKSPKLSKGPKFKNPKGLKYNKKIMPNPKYYKKKIKELRKGIK